MMPMAAPNRSSQVAWGRDDLSQDPHGAPDKASRVRQMFSSIASSYDLNNRLHSFGRDQVWRRRTVALCGELQGRRVLDIACGTGDLAQAFVSAGAEQVVGVDFTEAMLEQARLKAQRLPGVSTRLRYEWADALDLPFEDASFDVVSIAFGIRNVQRTEDALAQMHRVLRPRGALAILEFAEPPNRLLRALNHLYTGWVMPRTAALIARDRSGAYSYLPKSIESYLSPLSLRGAVESVGFDQVRQIPMTFGVAVATIARRMTV